MAAFFGVFLQQPRGTQRILIVDADTELHAAALAILQRAGVDCDHVADVAAAAERLLGQPYAAVLIDAVSTACDNDTLSALMPASAEARPVVVLAADDASRSFDPSLVSLIIRKPYDVQMVIGVLLACGTNLPQRRLVE